MKKSCILLFIMSIIFLMIAVYSVTSVVASQRAQQQLDSIEETSISKTFAEITVDLNLIFSSVFLCISAILGTFGIISSITKGRLSIVCIILDAPLVAYMFCGVIFSLVKETGLFTPFGLIAVLLALYMAGAITAFKTRKITE